jgi:hypothetical protein
MRVIDSPPILAPLPRDHRLVKSGELCGVCHQAFKEGERASLVPLNLSSPTQNKRAIATHARCHLIGRETPRGKVVDIIDGLGVLTPVVLDSGERVRFSDIGVNAND